jgi:hypothetical protein
VQALFVPGYNLQDIALPMHPFNKMFKEVKISRVVQVKECFFYGYAFIHQEYCYTQTYRNFLSLRQ